MRIHETDLATAAKNREQAGKAQLYGGCIFAVGMDIVVMSGSADAAFIPVTGLIIGALGRMVADSNKIGG